MDVVAQAHATPVHGRTLVFCSVVNEGFVAGFVCMERSLRANFPAAAEVPIFVIHDRDRAPLSDESRKIIRDLCTNVEFLEINPDDFSRVFDYAANVLQTPERLLPAFYILQALKLKGFERVICLDSDMIITGSLEELVTLPIDFGAVRAFDARIGQPRSFVNTGVMVFSDRYLAAFDADSIVSVVAERRPTPGSGKADQALINMVFKNDQIQYLPRRFNYTKREVMVDAAAAGYDLTVDGIKDFLRDNDVRVLHFIGEKPWNHKVNASERDYEPVERIWWEWFRAHADGDLLFHLHRLRTTWVDRYVSAIGSIVDRARKRPDLLNRFQRNLEDAMGL